MRALAAWFCLAAAALAMAAVPVLTGLPSDLGAEQATADDLRDAVRAARRAERAAHTTPVSLSLSETRP